MEVRDHGVFDVPQPVTVESARLTWQKLTLEKEHVTQRLAPVLERLAAGTASAEDVALASELGEQSRDLAIELQRVRVQLEVSERQQARKDAADKRGRFEDLIVQTRRKRAEFVRLYRQSCVVLGELCTAVDEAVAIANSSASGNVAGMMMPADRNAIAEMSEKIDLPTLLNGLTATTGFGWDWSISVVPLQKKGESK